jgi:hypothetical protein
MLAKMVNCEFLVPLASSLVTLVLRPLIADAVSVAGKIVAFARAAVEFLARDDTVVGCSVLDDDYCCPQPHCEPVVRRRGGRHDAAGPIQVDVQQRRLIGVPSVRRRGGRR